MLNCSKCGQFIGKDGFHDTYFDNGTNSIEIGYPLCKICMDLNNAGNEKHDDK